MLKRFLKLFLGFFLIALGVVLMRYAGLGLNPWSTFHDGVRKLTGLQFGTVTQLTGLTVIAISCFLKIYPGIGTLLNMYFCGFFINLIDKTQAIPIPNHIVIKFIYLILGMWILGYGIYLYLSAELGAGPRDGLMVGLVRITKRNVATIRTILECSVLCIGFLLGGQIGIGTIITAFSIGFIIQFIFKVHHFNPKEAKHLSFADTFRHLFK